MEFAMSLEKDRYTPKLDLPRRRMRMSEVSSALTWRSFLATSAAAGAFGLVLLAAPSYAQTVPAADAQASVIAAAEDNAIRPFHVNIPEAALVDLRQRIAATRWPNKETVADQSQGVQLATVQMLANYWAKDYDWRKAEAKLIRSRASRL
jgi:hypothetical protein